MMAADDALSLSGCIVLLFPHEEPRGAMATDGHFNADFLAETGINGTCQPSVTNVL